MESESNLMEKLVSIVIPTYGRSKMICRALDSVKRQTYSNIEVIVVNDNPPKTENAINIDKIIKKYGNIKNGITLVNNKKNVGGAEARNIGLKQSNGDYIAFLDDDDEILPEKIEKQVKFLDENIDVALVYCYSKTVFDDSNNNEVIYDKNNYHGNCMKEFLLDGTIAATTQWLCRKRDLEEIGGFDNVPSKQDSTLILKLLEAKKNIDVVPKVLSVYHVQNFNSISTSEKSKQGLSLFRERCRKHYDILTDKEIRNVEYKFAEQLYLKNYDNRLHRKENFNEMKKNRVIYAYYRMIYYHLFFFKHNNLKL